MPLAFAAHFRCPSELPLFASVESLAPHAEFFRLADVMCYGRRRIGATESVPIDVSTHVQCVDEQVQLPFDLSEVVANFQQEHYHRRSQGLLERIAGLGAARRLYYLVRPMLPLHVRKHLQRLSLRGWDRIEFPRWPVDFSVEDLMDHTMKLVLMSSGRTSVPFIWFWPDGAPSCAIMTHDVEAKAGRDFCPQLMDLDDSYGIKSAFQIVPERRYDVSEAFLENFRRRGFEINVHDLNHDGQLFRNRQQFLRRVDQINEYGRRFCTRGFRAGIMYRRQDWFDALEFSYDMSVPNVAHLEPQRGGCCTVTPYFVGDLLEIPLTTIQDYSLFHILGDYSTTLWKTQIDMVSARNGLISFIAHPDYLIEARARRVYSELLSHLRDLRGQGRVWMTLPAEVDRWWRSRREMKLMRVGNSWRIEGPDSHRARVAVATLVDDQVVYKVEDRAAQV